MFFHYEHNESHQLLNSEVCLSPYDLAIVTLLSDRWSFRFQYTNSDNSLIVISKLMVISKQVFVFVLGRLILLLLLFLLRIRVCFSAWLDEDLIDTNDQRIDGLRCC